MKDQDHKTISSLLTEHVDVNAPQPDGSTPLAWAVYLDQVDIVDLLMKAGAKVDTVDEYGETPLTLAATTGDDLIIEKLLKAGADATRGPVEWRNGINARRAIGKFGCR